jgi:hypothetical protein
MRRLTAGGSLGGGIADFGEEKRLDVVRRRMKQLQSLDYNATRKKGPIDRGTGLLHYRYTARSA